MNFLKFYFCTSPIFATTGWFRNVREIARSRTEQKCYQQSRDRTFGCTSVKSFARTSFSWSCRSCFNVHLDLDFTEANIDGFSTDSKVILGISKSSIVTGSTISRDIPFFRYFTYFTTE